MTLFKCQHCGTEMRDAGPIGYYCPEDKCPGIKKSRDWVESQLAQRKEQEAVKLLRERGYTVELPGAGACKAG